MVFQWKVVEILYQMVYNSHQTNKLFQNYGQSTKLSLFNGSYDKTMQGFWSLWHTMWRKSEPEKYNNKWISRLKFHIMGMRWSRQDVGSYKKTWNLECQWSKHFWKEIFYICFMNGILSINTGNQFFAWVILLMSCCFLI